MDGENTIEICDKEGWHKEFVLQKRLTFIGSDPRNDLVLNPLRGAGVAPRHLQLISAPGNSGSMSAINLSTASVPIGEAGGQTLEPNSAIDICDGGQFHVGDYVLIFHLTDRGDQPLATMPGIAVPGNGGSATPSPIGVRLFLPQVALAPDIPLEGTIYVCNQGTATGVQFTLQLDGLPQECTELAPAPILFPGAEKGVPFRLHHPRRPEYPAGMHKIVIRAQANEAYPGAAPSVSRDIRILPFYNHSLRILS